MKRHLLLTALLAMAAMCINAAEEARLLRFPAVGGNNIVFSYAGNLYRVGIDGGQAVKLTSDVGYECFARISPDGKTVAFTGQYDGNTEVFSIPVTGGEPKRLTWTGLVSRDMVGERMGPDNIVMCWTPDGSQVLFRSKQWCFSGLRAQLCLVPAEGGTPVEIPTTEGGFCSYSPDGKYLAMNRMFREFRTWKYYRGGQADDIWINTVGTTELERIPGCDPEAQDIFPMWVGKEIFYLSDRDRTMNLFSYNTETKKTEKVTSFTEYDCKFPSCSDRYIVFENGGYIYRFDAVTRNLKKVEITLADDNVYGRPEWRNVLADVSHYSLSPDGSRLLVEARGDYFSAPAGNGPVYHVENSPQSHEREAEWSPDGKYIAWFSDRDGEYQIYISGTEKPFEDAKCLTSFENGYPSDLQWSPDSKTIYFDTEKRDIWKLDVASGKAERILVSENNGFGQKTISPDGRWMAYTTDLDNTMNAVFLYDIAAGKSYQVTDKWYSASSPLFSKDGKYLYFTSMRDFTAQYSSVEWNASYNLKSYVFILPLSADTPDPTRNQSDEFVPAKTEPAPAKADAPASKSKKASKKADAPKESGLPAMRVDTEGIGQRMSALPLEPGRYRLVHADNGKLYYTSGRGLQCFDLNSLKSNEVCKETAYTLSFDGKKALFMTQDGKFTVSDFGAPVRADRTLDTSGLNMFVDHRAEWKQIFEESWRVTRDGFYVENMHGADWDHIHDKYGQMLPYVNHRHDLSFLIGEMLGELNIGHAYITSGDSPKISRIPTGMLGAKFSKDEASGSFKIEKIFRGANWDASLRSPLTEPGVKAAVGEYITAVNGVSASAYADIHEALIGKVGQMVSLEIASSADGKGARTVYVKPVADETQLAYYEWVQTNIEKVEAASDGQIGYIHIPDMSVEGLDMFTKLFYTQLDKKALIIDDRMNGGGNVSPMILERLQREVYRVSMYRNGKNEPVPNQAFYGPKVCLIDKYSSSDGDLFPYGFRKLGLGPLIGKRSWGGIVGISGSKPFVDGQDMRTPFFTSYSTEGDWIIEGHGVDPDIEVDINPFEDYLGTDAQLDKAVEYLLKQLESYVPLPGTPAAPVKN